MGLSALYQAIKARWDVKSLDDTITGGIWQGRSRVPDSVSPPFVSVSLVGENVRYRYATTSPAKKIVEGHVAEIQFRLVGDSGSTTTNTYARAIRNTFDYAYLNMGSDYNFVHGKFTSKVQTDDEEHPNALVFSINYEFLWEETVPG